MARKKPSVLEDTAKRNYRRENALRPNPFLGYDRNTLAMYLIERGAYPIAESELRRAIWLNPYEPVFKANLAWCLYKMGQGKSARECLREAVKHEPDNAQVRQIAALIGVGNHHTGKQGADEA